MKINEADRIGTALWRSSIPQKYKKYPILGQGATSIVLDKGDGRVLMLTRDTMKMEWLTRNWGLDIGEVIDEFEVYHQKSRTLGEMPVYVIDLPLLYPLSAKSKQQVKKAIAEYQSIQMRGNPKQMDILNKYLDKHPEGMFAQLVEFLQNYDDNQYHTDFLMRNFMQAADGNIILIDPIVSAELLKSLRELRGWK